MSVFYLQEQQKQIFTEAVRVYLVEYYFHDFVPEALYRLLCDFSPKHPNFDLREWLVKLQRVCINNVGKIIGIYVLEVLKYNDFVLQVQL